MPSERFHKLSFILNLNMYSYGECQNQSSQGSIVLSFLSNQTSARTMIIQYMLSSIYMSIFVLPSMYAIVQFLLSFFYFKSESFFPLLELEPGVLFRQVRALN